MYDRESISLWIHTTGEAAIGKYKGRTLQFLPSTVTTWKTWRGAHPQTLVLDVKKGSNPRFSLRENPSLGGLSVGDPSGPLKFYGLPLLQQKRVVNDELAGKKIVIVFDTENWAFAAFERGGCTFSWHDGRATDQTGKFWQLLGGSTKQHGLTPVPDVTWLTKAWKTFYPEGVIFRP